MKAVYLIASIILFAALALTMPLYVPLEVESERLSIGLSDFERRQAMYELDMAQYGDFEARILLMVRQQTDSLLAIPQPDSTSR